MKQALRVSLATVTLALAGCGGDDSDKITPSDIQN